MLGFRGAAEAVSAGAGRQPTLNFAQSSVVELILHEGQYKRLRQRLKHSPGPPVLRNETESKIFLTKQTQFYKI